MVSLRALDFSGATPAVQHAACQVATKWIWGVAGVHRWRWSAIGHRKSATDVVARPPWTSPSLTLRDEGGRRARAQVRRGAGRPDGGRG